MKTMAWGFEVGVMEREQYRKWKNHAISDRKSLKRVNFSLWEGWGAATPHNIKNTKGWQQWEFSLILIVAYDNQLNPYLTRNRIFFGGVVGLKRNFFGDMKFGVFMMFFLESFFFSFFEAYQENWNNVDDCMVIVL